MIAQDRVRPGPEGTSGGGNLWALVPEDYKTAWNIIKTLRPRTFIPL